MAENGKTKHFNDNLIKWQLLRSMIRQWIQVCNSIHWIVISHFWSSSFIECRVGAIAWQNEDSEEESYEILKIFLRIHTIALNVHYNPSIDGGLRKIIKFKNRKKTWTSTHELNFEIAWVSRRKKIKQIMNRFCCHKKSQTFQNFDDGLMILGLMGRQQRVLERADAWLQRRWCGLSDWAADL